MTNQEVQVVETPVTEPAQVVPEVPVTEKEKQTPKNEAAIPQSEWQQAQEKIRNLELQSLRQAQDRFEAENPIVKTEKYKDKWVEALKQKNTPGHRYQHLDYQELLNLIRDTSLPSEPKPQPLIVPSLNPSLAPKPQGEISSEVNDWLGMRYNKEQIESTKR